ncbi:MAG: hypothetical protein PGN13_07710 [Patulibacter minatonensis]
MSHPRPLGAIAHATRSSSGVRVVALLRAMLVLCLLAGTTATGASAASTGKCAMPRWGELTGSSPEWYRSGTAATTVMVIPVDYSDAVGTATQLSSLTTEITGADALVNTLSHGSLDVTYRYPNTTPKWLHLGHSQSEYTGSSPRSMTSDATALALAELGSAGFSGVDYVMYVSTGAYFRAGTTRFAVTYPDGTQNRAFIKAPATLDRTIYAHETLHLFGLADLYVENPTASLPAFQTDHFDLMGETGNPSLAPLAFAQWAMGWITPSQVSCVANTASTTVPELRPLESSLTTGKKAMIVPLSTSRMLTIEARSTPYGPAGCMDGVVITLVDTSVKSWFAPAKVQPAPTGSCPALVGGTAGAWQVGSQYTEPLSGTKVTVLYKNPDGSYGVQVSPTLRFGNTVLGTSSVRAYWRLGEPRAMNYSSVNAPTSTQSRRIHNSAEPTLPGQVNGANADTYYGQPSVITGSGDTSQRFDGTRWIDVPLVNYSHDFTLTAWSKLDAGAPAGYVFGSSDNGVRLRVSSTGVLASVDRFGGDGLSKQVSATTASNSGTWVFWAVTVVGNQLIVFRNGGEVGRTTIDPAGNTTIQGQIGALDGANAFSGLIDDVAVFSDGLPASTLSTLYSRALTP